MMTPALQFQHVVQGYARQPVLRGVDLAVAQGEFVGLVGVNGAGKTSLLHCLFDFCALTQGRIEIVGVTHRLPRARAPLAFLPERFTPPYYLTGADFLKYLLTLHGAPYRPAEVAAMLQALDLDAAALTAAVRTYSKGMTQKLGLAGCLLADKAIYVLDEPMSGLDPKARALLKRQLGHLRQRGRTVFFTSHALADVEQLCDRMAILHAGTIRFAGTPAQCCRQFDADELERAYMRCIDAPAA